MTNDRSARKAITWFLEWLFPLPVLRDGIRLNDLAALYSSPQTGDITEIATGTDKELTDLINAVCRCIMNCDKRSRAVLTRLYFERHPSIEQVLSEFNVSERTVRDYKRRAIDQFSEAFMTECDYDIISMYQNRPRKK